MTACAFNTVHVRAAPGRSPELGERLQKIAEAIRTAQELHCKDGLARPPGPRYHLYDVLAGPCFPVH